VIADYLESNSPLTQLQFRHLHVLGFRDEKRIMKALDRNFRLLDVALRPHPTASQLGVDQFVESRIVARNAVPVQC
jgi:hypothetical protein